VNDRLAHDPRPTDRGAWRLVAMRDFRVRARDKGFFISTGITLAVLTVFILLRAFGDEVTPSFDLGITGRDWIEERNADVVTLTELHYSKATARPIQVVLAVAADSPASSIRDLPSGLVVHTEYPELTRRYFAKHGVDADVQLSYGATEAKVPDIADAVVEITETGRALRAAGLRVLDTILVSYTELIANPTSYQDADKRKAMEQLQTLLSGALEARGRVLLKLNVDAANLDAVIALLPALKSPTVSALSGEDGYAVETVVSKSEINTLIPALKDAGAAGIIELPIAKIVH